MSLDVFTMTLIILTLPHLVPVAMGMLDVKTFHDVGTCEESERAL